MSTSETEVSFELAIEQLERIVAQLESGDVPLEKAIELYQEGVRLSHLCGVKLEQVEKKIEMLVEGESGTVSRKPFQPVLEDKGN
ncbi:exodeoxyribonuclease VII small subunit [Paenibacillus sp. V4I3]|jgi:exodeoxyribonuclease VII small subunit|uniref:Exodeoxyribonuclease 7 small subunit n=2 Tax=Paenibacillus TaxID=44249 RepID=A0ABX1Z847_9BACL|nr:MULTISPECIES: exodeoxyribonuclease VII small subunit [Paenibacillus]MDF2644201.1 xseB [Paenibacillus sp.]KQX46464.1 exodeoxyribonuclease VII small subunit [Paenibacillus sp. Root444D2]KRE33349.1 exodeoxyribonuclease VII small subunit [Paenibacillus sp. Soil724D2]MDQ0874980.1 exodeoxyribonuclease VII small subunit [Paenibacillus sp. V4I3]MDQ0889268.1 exodeoxyribonuclease VII small subunit [Paenibacillus sp. V4I9]